MNKIGQQVFEKYDIDLNKIYENSIKLKCVNKEWYPIVMLDMLRDMNITTDSYHHNKQSNEFTIFFNNEKDALEFDNEFLPKFTKCLNKFIINICGENPKDYNRAGVIETRISEKTITISF